MSYVEDKIEDYVKNADMTDDMIKTAIYCGKNALKKFSIEKDIAKYIKDEFDR